MAQTGKMEDLKKALDAIVLVAMTIVPLIYDLFAKPKKLSKRRKVISKNHISKKKIVKRPEKNTLKLCDVNKNDSSLVAAE